MEKEIDILGSKRKRVKSEKEKLVSVNRVVKRVLILSSAYLMEEGFDEDKLIDYYGAIERWSGAIDEHWITIQEVIKMINERTGADISW